MTSGSKPERISRLVLDTSAYSRFRARDFRVRDLIAEAEAVLVPAAVLGELHGGFEAGTRSRENRQALAEFLAEPFVSVIDADASVARQYGRVYAALRRAGRPIPTNDIWIAASAASWVIVAADMMAYWWTFTIPARRCAGAASQPIRQPVMA